MKKVLITGGTGLIGTALRPILKQAGYQPIILSRSSSNDDDNPFFRWDISKGFVEEGALDDIHALIHLAGAGIADKRWTDSRKRVIIDSRVDSISLLYEKFKEKNEFPEIVISASGINYYGSKTTNRIMKEEDPPGNEFISEVCLKWEAAADLFSKTSRVVKLRTGVVLAGEDSALQRIALPVRYGFGAPIGNGKQFMPYLHIIDLCRMYLYALQNNNMRGAYNAVNGDPVTNEDLTQAIAEVLNKPLWMPNVPGFALKLVYGELASILLGGSRASAEKVMSSGFEFEFSDLYPAIEDLLG